MNYADPFGIQETTPLSRALRRIELDANQQLNWPTGYLGPDYIASINVITPVADGLSLSLPPAPGASEGTGFLMYNKGSHVVAINNYVGTQLTTLDPGQAKYLYCEDATLLDGVWNTVTFGEGVSEADAVQLAGMGLTVTEGRLSLGLTVSTTSSDVNIISAHRGKVFVNNGGSININLPQYTDVGNNFFFCVHNGGAGTITIKPATTNKIDDYDSLSLAPNESAIVCCSGGAKWYTLGYGRSTQFQFTKLVKDVSAGGTITLTSAEASNKLLQFIGNPASNVTINVPSVVGIYYVQNTYSGPNSLTLTTQAGNGLSLNSGDRAIVYCDGVNVVSAQSVAVGVNLSVVDGSLNNPSIGFSSDPNTGIYRADFDTVGIVSSGAEAARFHKDESAVLGKLAVGLADPVAQFHVYSAVPEAMRLQADSGYLSFFSGNGQTRNGAIFGLVKELRLAGDDVDSIVSVFINASKKFEVNKNGIKVSGSIVDANNNTFATTGSNNFTAVQYMPAQRGKLTNIPVISGIATMDVSQSSSFSVNVSGPTQLVFTGKPAAGQEQCIYVKVSNGGSNVTYGAMCQFPDSGLKPTLSAAGRDLLAVWYDPETDAFIVGRAFKDYKA